MAKRKPVPKPYNDGTWSKARMMSFIRSLFRQGSMRWGPKNAAMRRVRAKYTGQDKRRKWTYTCEGCSKEFKGSEVKAHHTIPCGELKDWGDIEGFARRLFCEADGFEVLCGGCHDKAHGKGKA